MASLKDRIGWEQDPKKRGTYTRRPASHEKFFVTMRDFNLATNIAGCVVVRSTLPNLEERLPYAWRMLRMSCPSIAMTIEHSDDEYYFSYDSNEDFGQWEAETFFIHKDVNGEQLYHQLGNVPRAQLHWLEYESKHEFYIKLPHDYMDAIGLMHLTDVFLDILSKGDELSLPETGSEVTKLSPPFAVTSGVPQADHGELQEMVQKIAEDDAEVGCIVPVKDYQNATGAQRLVRVLSKESTVAIIEQTKRHELTVSHAFHAAMVLALLKLNPPAGESTKFTPLLPISLRNRLLPQFLGRNNAVGMYLIAMNIFLTLPVAADYDSEQIISVAKSFKAEYERLQTHPRLTNLSDPCGDMYQAALKGPKRPMKLLPFLSSLGVADQHLRSTYGKEITVEDFAIRPDIMGASQLLLWTFGNRMHLSMNYTAGAYDDEFMQAWMKEVIATLESGLEIKID